MSRDRQVMSVNTRDDVSSRRQRRCSKSEADDVSPLPYAAAHANELRY